MESHYVPSSSHSVHVHVRRRGADGGRLGDWVIRFCVRNFAVHLRQRARRAKQARAVRLAIRLRAVVELVDGATYVPSNQRAKRVERHAVAKRRKNGVAAAAQKLFAVGVLVTVASKLELPRREAAGDFAVHAARAPERGAPQQAPVAARLAGGDGGAARLAQIPKAAAVMGSFVVRHRLSLYCFLERVVCRLLMKSSSGQSLVQVIKYEHCNYSERTKHTKSDEHN